MRLLLDTHVVWWLFTAPERLGRELTTLLDRADTLPHYSPLVFTELAIKRANGGVRYQEDVLLSGLEALRMSELPLRREHAIIAGRLPLHHRDPFDRLMIGQAIALTMTMVSADRIFPLYDVALLRV